MRFTSVVAGAGLMLFACIAWPLLSRVEHLVNVPLAAGNEASPMTFVRIMPDAGGSPDTGRVHRTRFVLPDPGRVLRHRQLRLLVGTRGTSPDLERAELSIEGTRCVYRTATGAAFPNNSTLDLERGDGCVPLEGTATGKLLLTVTLRNQARLVLWAHTVPAASVGSETLVVDPAPELNLPEALVVSGRLVDHGAPAARHRRVELLAYVWQVASGSWWLWFTLGLAVGAITVGSLGLWNPSPYPTLAGNAIVRGSSAFMLTAGLGVLYATLIPPFQAPDEPHHFVAFTEVVSRPELVQQADAWAALGHVTRIRFRPAERFTPSDVGHPDRVWEHPYAPDSAVRGGGVHAMWEAIAPIVRSRPAPLAFLSLRIGNAILLAAFVGLAIALIVRYGEVPSPHLLAFPLLLVPTLPFFGMHVSNHAPVIGAYVLTACGLVSIVLNRKGDYVSGLLVGVGWALAIALSRSAIPLAPLIAAFAAARLLFAPPDARIAASAMFWSGLIVPLLLLLSVSGNAAYLASNARLGSGMLPVVLQELIERVTTSPWLLVLPIPVLAALEQAFLRIRMNAGAHLRPGARAFTRGTAAAAAGAVAVLMAGSLFVRYPVLATIDPLNRPPAMEYVRDALLAGLTVLRLDGPDYRTSMTFWGGFGWLETLPSDVFVCLLTGATGVALIGLLIYIARTADVRRGFFLAASFAGFAAGLAAYALSLTQVEVAIDLAGRYVFGLYLTMVMVCWSGLALIPTGALRPRLQAAVSVGCVVACTGVHAYCLRLILYRYF